jgi:hypothetical protein
MSFTDVVTNDTVYSVPGRNDLKATESFSSVTISSSNSLEVSVQTSTMESTENQYKIFHRNSLYAAFRPFFVLMRLGGLFFIQPKALHLHLSQMQNTDDLSFHQAETNSNDNSVSSQKLTGKGHSKWELFEQWSRVYCFGVFLMVWIFGAKFLYSFRYAMEGLKFSQANLGLIVTQMDYAIWIVQIIITHFLMLRACWNQNEMFSLFLGWDRLHFSCPLPKGTCNGYE